MYCYGIDGYNIKQYIKLFKKYHQFIQLSTIRYIVIQIFDGLSFIHSIGGFIHADIKPENIFISVSNSTFPNIFHTANVDIKLADFGNALRINRDIHTFKIQTREYRAPEII